MHKNYSLNFWGGGLQRETSVLHGAFCRGSGFSGSAQWKEKKKVAVKIKTGQEEFLGGKLAVPNGREDLGAV